MPPQGEGGWRIEGVWRRGKPGDRNGWFPACQGDGRIVRLKAPSAPGVLGPLFDGGTVHTGGENQRGNRKVSMTGKISWEMACGVDRRGGGLVIGNEKEGNGRLAISRLAPRWEGGAGLLLLAFGWC